MKEDREKDEMGEEQRTMDGDAWERRMNRM